MKPEQASKVTIRMPTLLPFGEGRVSGEASIPAPARSAGVVGTARWKGGSGNRQRSGPFKESCSVRRRRSLPSASTYYDKIHREDILRHAVGPSKCGCAGQGRNDLCADRGVGGWRACARNWFRRRTGPIRGGGCRTGDVPGWRCEGLTGLSLRRSHRPDRYAVFERVGLGYCSEVSTRN